MPGNGIRCLTRSGTIAQIIGFRIFPGRPIEQFLRLLPGHNGVSGWINGRVSAEETDEKKVRFQIAFHPAVKCHFTGGRISWERFKRVEIFFRDHDTHIAEFSVLVAVRLPDRALVPIRFSVVNVFAAKVAFDRDELANMRRHALAQNLHIVGLHIPPRFCIVTNLAPRRECTAESEDQK